VKLLEPLALGATEAPNRVMFGPHVTNLGRGRSLSERHVAYYERRARGGCGIVVVEEAAVHHGDWPYERSPLASQCPNGWSAIAAACRPHGALCVAAIGHTGGQGSSAYSQAALWAPSGVPEVNTREVPKVMELTDIESVVASFGVAAGLARDAGMDGVEVNAGQHSLVRQFLSGLTNQRGDAYGQDRLLFARQVLESVRAHSGGGLVGLRLSCDELAPWAGIVPEAAAAMAVELAVFVDYLVVVRGGIFSAHATRPDTHSQPGFNLDLAGALRATVDGATAVVAQGSIVDVAQAEWAIDAGRCDAVEMTRAQIADPDLARLADAHPERIRPCVLCNQLCMVRDNRNPIVSCIGNPHAGHETEEAEPTGSAPAALPMLVVGGGPAGLECARVAAGRGHQVRLLERSDHLGGALATAAVGLGRAPLRRLVEWLEAECRRLGVEIVTGADVRSAEVTEVAVLCTGSSDGWRDYETGDGADVRSARAVLEEVETGGLDRLPDGPVAVWDPVGGPEGVSVAELVATSGRAVALITPDLIAASQLGLTGDLAPANTRLQAAGVEIVRRAVLVSVGPGQVVVEDRFGGARTTLEARLLVDAGHRLPDESLWKATGGRHLRAGDAVAPRTAGDAVLEGRRAALRAEQGAALVTTGPVAGGP
jgi:2,4-dienoyl-CoA reductase (NADPH2)